ncbi:hypothetical protein USDA257_c41800 [Sinorhizobium fredii USDA 257]|uniref:Uncharacterized protein n=1 Tax=Sinorhizobium fredii (strain USDA 257) TaxID=1185652 RepID=I3XA14_SINF2|nr:hypothetical protein USDA257_c41800 [Sinorhizobium fredii USDA 257]
MKRIDQTMRETSQTVETSEKGRYFKAPVFAVAPMIDGTETAKK